MKWNYSLFEHHLPTHRIKYRKKQSVINDCFPFCSCHHYQNGNKLNNWFFLICTVFCKVEKRKKKKPETVENGKNRNNNNLYLKRKIAELSNFTLRMASWTNKRKYLENLTNFSVSFFLLGIFCCVLRSRTFNHFAIMTFWLNFLFFQLFSHVIQAPVCCHFYFNLLFPQRCLSEWLIWMKKI